MKLNIVKRTVLATALAVATAVTGVAGQAQAFTFGEGDLVLAIYGNNTEALLNLGSASSLFSGAGNLSLDVSTALAAASVGTNPVKYSLFGHDSTLGSLYAATSFASSAINPNQLALTFQFEQSIGMAGQGGFAGDTIAKADAKSFFSNLNQAGTGSMAGSWPVAMQGNIGDILNVMLGDVNNNSFAQAGANNSIQAFLSASGILTVGNLAPAAVPLPAGVVLFGTGLVALVGIARRSFNRMAA